MEKLPEVVKQNELSISDIKAKKEEPAAAVPDPAPAEMAPAPCPDNPGAIYTLEYCEKCDKRQGCPAWV